MPIKSREVLVDDVNSFFEVFFGFFWGGKDVLGVMGMRCVGGGYGWNRQLLREEEVLRKGGL